MKEDAVPKTEEALRALIDRGIEESLFLEYKRGAALSREGAAVDQLSKDVSAFANSAGGVLIYGIAEHGSSTGKGHLPERIDPIQDPKITREWVEHTLLANIRPRLSAEIFAIRTSNPAGTVFVIHVPAGETAYQASDYKYYRRYNFSNQPMADHEIRDVMGRNQYPVVDLTAAIEEGPASDIMGRTSSKNYRWLKLGLHNAGKKVVGFAYASVALPAHLVFGESGEIVEIDGALWRKIAIRLSAPESSSPYLKSAKNTDPLLPGLSIHLYTVQLGSASGTLKESDLLVATVYADDAPVRTVRRSLLSLQEE